MRFRSPDSDAALRELQSGWLEDLSGRRPLSPDRRAATFGTPHRGSLEDRWDIYTYGYLERIAEALENDYRATARVLGAAAFRSLAARYVRACPPRSYDLGRAGDRLPRFLEDDPLTGKLPFLPDLARLEWAIAEAFVAPDVEPLRWSDLCELGPEIAAGIPLRLRPGTTLIHSAWPIRDIWTIRDRPDREIAIETEGRPSSVLIFRRGLDVRSRTVDAAEARLLEAAARNQSLTAIDALSTGDTGPEEIARLLELFRTLVDEGLFLKPEVPASPETSQ